jgi:hypothetical protein
MNPEPARKLCLPEDLCRAAEKKFAHRFGSLEEFLIALMSECLREDALKMDEHEQRVIEQRLKALGYV